MEDRISFVMGVHAIKLLGILKMQTMKHTYVKFDESVILTHNGL